MVHTLKPLSIIEVPLLLGVDALIHILHRKVKVMGRLWKASSMLVTLPLVSIRGLKLT